MIKNKKNVKTIVKFSILGISAVMCVTTLGLAVGYHLDRQHNKSIYYHNTNNYKIDYLSFINQDAINIINNSTYSISFKYYKNNSSYINYGTAWSLGVNKNSWYLLTNLHVVREYLSYRNSYGYNITRVLNDDFQLQYQNISNGTSSGIVDFLPTIGLGISDNTDIEIITDIHNNDKIHLFADETSSNKYELDIAMIKITDYYIANEILTNNFINKPLNNYSESDTLFSLRNLIVGGYPIKEWNHALDRYYLEVIDDNRFRFMENNYWNKVLYNKIKFDSFGFKQYASMLVSDRYINNKNNNWSLNGGSSGAPLYNSFDYINDLPIWTPYAMYCGFISIENKPEMISPCFVNLVSFEEGCSYNVYKNILEYIK